MTTTTKRKEPETKAKPALHVQVGAVRIPIWQNAGKEGSFYFLAGKPELSYKDGEGRWQASKSYGARDLVNLIKAASLAHSELLQRNRPNQEAPVQEETE